MTAMAKELLSTMIDSLFKISRKGEGHFFEGEEFIFLFFLFFLDSCKYAIKKIGVVGWEVGG